MKKNRPLAFAGRSPVAVLVAGLFASATAQAIEIDTANTDVKIRFDNTLRLNTGMRVKEIDPGIGNNPANDESDHRFKKHDITSTRIELYSEFDVAFKNSFGARVSGAAWYDNKYDKDKVFGHPALVNTPNYPGNNVTPYFKRYYAGPSGEFLDAFVWGNFKLGERDLNVKVGRHAQLWGEGVFPTASANSSAFSQAPTDGLKQLAAPGATAKEITLPTNQITAALQVADNVSIVGLYALEWRPSRAGEGGSFHGSDAILFGPPLISFGVPRRAPVEGDKGSWGTSLRWRPTQEFFDRYNTNLSFTYRKFDDMTSSWPANVNLAGGAAEGRAVYARDIELLAFGANANIGSNAYGFELSHRRNTPLVSTGLVTAANHYEGARGNTWHALVNGIYTFNKSAIWDTASLVAELTYQRLDRVTSKSNLFKSLGTTPNACTIDAIVRGCATKDASHLAINFAPAWQQVLPSTDLALGMVYQYGLHGNAPAGGISKGAQVIQLSISADYQVKHKLTLAYTDYYGKKAYLGSTSAAGAFYATTGSAVLDDRDAINLTYTYNF